MIALAAGPSVPLAFLAGLVSFLSPCVFPLIPAYAAYLGGRAGRPALATADGPSLGDNAVRVPVIANGKQTDALPGKVLRGPSYVP